MPGQAGAVREAVLEEAGHQWLGVGQGGDAVAHVARRQGAQLAAQAAGAAAVVGHGDDSGEVGSVLLQPPQEGGQAGAAADGHDLWAPTQGPLVVDHAHDALVAVAVGHHRGDDRVVQLPDGVEDEAPGREHEHAAAYVAGDELQSQVVDEARKGKAGDVSLAHDVGETEGHDRHAHDHQGKPSLDVHARVEPLQEVGFEQASHSPILITSFPRKCLRVVTQFLPQHLVDDAGIGAAPRLPHDLAH